MADIINVKILEDGMISYETEGISGTNHASADELLTELEMALGGEVIRKHNPKGKKQQRVFEKAHAH